MNYISDQIDRVMRTVREFAQEVETIVEDAASIWRRMRELLDRALMPYPEARAAVVREVEEEIVRSR